MSGLSTLVSAFNSALNDGLYVYENRGKDSFLDKAQNYLNTSTALLSIVDIGFQLLEKELPIGFSAVAFQANLTKVSIAIANLG